MLFHNSKSVEKVFCWINLINLYYKTSTRLHSA